MSIERITALAETYRTCGQMFGERGEVVPMLAHQEVASLLGQTALAIRDAERAANGLDWSGVDLAVPHLRAFYQPRARQVAVWCGGQLVEFSEDEAETLHSALGEALAVRAAARAFAREAEGLAA